MSYVDTVKEKHRFEQSFRALIKYLNVMCIEELELAMAYLADDLISEKNEAKKVNIQVKGASLRIYTELRVSGILEQRKMQRFLYNGEMKKYFEHFAQVKREAELIKRDKLLLKLHHDYNLAMEEYLSADKKWAKERGKLSFTKRLFYKEPRPKKPLLYPHIPFLPSLAFYVKEEQKRGTLKEFFIGNVRKFELLALSEAPINFTTNDITFLAQ